jgi:hypothetical protein
MEAVVEEEASDVFSCVLQVLVVPVLKSFYVSCALLRGI